MANEVAVPARKATFVAQGAARGTAGESAVKPVKIFLKKPWARNIEGVEVGTCIAEVTLHAGVDVNLVVDAIRNGLAGEERPQAPSDDE